MELRLPSPSHLSSQIHAEVMGKSDVERHLGDECGVILKSSVQCSSNLLVIAK